MSEAGGVHQEVSPAVPAVPTTEQLNKTSPNQANLAEKSKLAQVKERALLKTQEGLRAVRAKIAQFAHARIKRSEVDTTHTPKVQKSLGRRIVESPVTRSVVIGGRAAASLLGDAGEVAGNVA